MGGQTLGESDGQKEDDWGGVKETRRDVQDAEKKPPHQKKTATWQAKAAPGRRPCAKQFVKGLGQLETSLAPTGHARVRNTCSRGFAKKGGKPHRREGNAGQVDATGEGLLGQTRPD